MTCRCLKRRGRKGYAAFRKEAFCIEYFSQRHNDTEIDLSAVCREGNHYKKTVLALLCVIPAFFALKTIRCMLFGCDLQNG